MPTTASSSLDDGDWLHERMSQALEGRRIRGTLRRLPAAPAAAAAEHDTSAVTTSKSTNTSTSISSSPSQDTTPVAAMDFSSNDYLGLAQDPDQSARVEAKWQQEQRESAVATTSTKGTIKAESQRWNLAMNRHRRS